MPTLSYGDRKAILPRMFLKEKFTADGEFDRMKGQACRWRRQAA
jgi:hypothetical protein